MGRENTGTVNINQIMEYTMKTTIFTLFLIAGLTVDTSAQSPWLVKSKQSSLTIEWDKPLFDSDLVNRDMVTSISSVMFVTGKAKVNDKFRIVAELPLSHFGIKDSEFTSGTSHTQVGNIYLGGELDANTRNEGTALTFELGVRIPTMGETEDAGDIGAFTGLVSESERHEAFFIDTWSIPVYATTTQKIADFGYLNFRGGALYDIYTDDLSFLDNELHLLYTISTTITTKPMDALIGFSGRHHVVGNGAENTKPVTQLRGGIGKRFSHWTPSIYARLPLSRDFNALVDVAYGFSLSLNF